MNYQELQRKYEHLIASSTTAENTQVDSAITPHSLTLEAFLPKYVGEACLDELFIRHVLQLLMTNHRQLLENVHRSVCNFDSTSAVFEQLHSLLVEERERFEGSFEEQTDTSAAQSPDQPKIDRPYIPKYNTFRVNRNEDLHIESDDEGFQVARLPVNVLRSKGLMNEFHLNPLNDLKHLFSSSDQNVTNLERRLNELSDQRDWKNSDAFVNYKHFEKWSSSEQMDIYRELYGENEQIVLNRNNVLTEIRYQLQQLKKRRPDQQPVPKSLSICSFQFQEVYFMYLRSIVEYMLSRNDLEEIKQQQSKQRSAKLLVHYPKELLHIDRSPISIEYIGYLSKWFYLPWKHYDIDTLSHTIFPWLIFSKGISSNLLTSLRSDHDEMQTIPYRIAGLKELGYEKELMDLQTQILLNPSANYTDLVSMKELQDYRSAFYTNERNRYQRKIDVEQERLEEAIKTYLAKEELRSRIFTFCAMHK